MKKNLKSIIKIKEKAEKELLFLPGVMGVDVGYKYRKGKKTKQIVIRIFVENKFSSNSIEMKTRSALPKKLSGIPTDIIEESYSTSAAAYDRNVLPDNNYYPILEGGLPISVYSNRYLNEGTGGIILKKKGDNDNAYLLTNYHVVSVDGSVYVNGEVYSPSKKETNLNKGLIGHIDDHFLGELDGTFADVGIIKIDKRVKINNEITQAGKIKGISSKSINQLIDGAKPVKKRGRTTHYTKGFVDGLAGSHRVNYKGHGMLPVTNAFRISPDRNLHGMFASKGDSGSVLLDSENKLLGLLFAASSNNGTALVSPIKPILKRYKLELISDTFVRRWNKRADEFVDPNADFDAFKSFIRSLNLRYFQASELWITGDSNNNPNSTAYGLNTPPPKSIWKNIVETISILDELRKRLKAPIYITSAHRSASFNEAIGGSSRSQHIKFNALDFIVQKPNTSPADWSVELKKMRDEEKLFKGGIGVYQGFIHLDTRGVNRDW